ncbi:MAG: hypothetical protein M3063_05860, partial [Actinomycetota bacterium]|nr:hypothetical protein [Actinomycetota bacterium]
HSFDQGFPRTPALVVGPDAELLDVGRFIDLLDEHIADCRSLLIDGHPRSPRGRIPDKGLQWQRLVVGDPVQVDAPEPLNRETLDVLKGGRVLWHGRPNPDAHPARFA